MNLAGEENLLSKTRAEGIPRHSVNCRRDVTAQSTPEAGEGRRQGWGSQVTRGPLWHHIMEFGHCPGGAEKPLQNLKYRGSKQSQAVVRISSDSAENGREGREIMLGGNCVTSPIISECENRQLPVQENTGETKQNLKSATLLLVSMGAKVDCLKRVLKNKRTSGVTIRCIKKIIVGRGTGKK